MFVAPNSTDEEAIALQQYIEGQLRGAFDRFPVFLTPKCHFSLRKYFCSSSFIYPEHTSLFNVLTENNVPMSLVPPLSAEILNAPFTLPSFPHYSICESFANDCADFIAAANSSQLTPNCSATNTNSGNTYQLYPKER
jgi:hypothetical protein